MGCQVHIGDKFKVVPARIRKKLRDRLERICAVLEALPSRESLVESLAESSRAITVEEWFFRYEFEPATPRLVVIEARPPDGEQAL